MRVRLERNNFSSASLPAALVAKIVEVERPIQQQNAWTNPTIEYVEIDSLDELFATADQFRTLAERFMDDAMIVVGVDRDGEPFLEFRLSIPCD